MCGLPHKSGVCFGTNTLSHMLLFKGLLQSVCSMRVAGWSQKCFANLDLRPFRLSLSGVTHMYALYEVGSRQFRVARLWGEVVALMLCHPVQCRQRSAAVLCGMTSSVQHALLLMLLYCGVQSAASAYLFSCALAKAAHGLLHATYALLSCLLALQHADASHNFVLVC